MDRIDLAHESEFRLGCLTVRPGLRQIVRDASEKDGGAEELVEPRVMQVLVVLARTPGAILSRDDLTSSCWEGRVVGEDAINRVISRLRRVAEGIGEGSFRIETVTKIGYRLVTADMPANGAPPADLAAEVRALKLDRRAMLAGSGLAITAAAGWWGWHRLTAPPADAPPPEVADLMKQAETATGQGTPEGNSQATGLLRRVVQLRPDYASAWGKLALAYAGAARGGPAASEAASKMRATQAAARALQLEPDNPDALASRILLVPSMRNWLQNERKWREILARHPDYRVALRVLSGVLLSVGRVREATAIVLGDTLRNTTGPEQVSARIQAYWALGRLEEADAAAHEAAELYPTHFSVWFRRFYLLLYTGRAAEALALGENSAGRPTGIPDWNFDLTNQIARAMTTHVAADIDKALAANVDASHRGAGFAANTIQYASVLGRLDTAFRVAEAYYFGRGFETGELDFSPEQGSYTRRSSRLTTILFLPSTVAMRADPRFDRLVGEIGLKKYWAESGTVPDYKKG